MNCKWFAAALAAVFVCTPVMKLHAQAPAPAAKAPAAADAEDEDPFAPIPETPLPPGMTGSTTTTHVLG